MSQQSPNPDDPQSQPQNVAQPPPAKRRRWPWVILVLLLILIALVVLAPTIASTSPVRNLIVGQVNNNINGRMAVDNWSLGWMSGAVLNEVRLYDDQNAEILHAPRIKTNLTLMDAARGNIDLGDTVIDIANVVLRVDENGATNFERIAKSTPKPKKEPESSELPSVRGKVTVNLANGTITAPNQPPVHIQPSTVVLNIPDINGTITNDVKLAYRVGDDPAGTITVNGSIDLAENNQLQIEKLTADQKIALEALNLGTLAPFLATAVPNLQLGGIANGGLAVKAQGITGISADGEIVVANFLVGGEPLNGDTFKTSKLTLPVQITRSGEGNATLIKVEKLGVEMPELQVAINGEVPQQALVNLSEMKEPGAEGQLHIAVNANDLKAIADKLPRTLRLQEGVAITSGKFAQTSDIRIQPKQVEYTQTLDVTAAGTSAGQPIALSPIHSQTSLVAIPAGKGRLPGFRDVKVELKSGFAEISGGGPSLAQLNLVSTFDLEKLQKEGGQFMALPADLKGSGKLAINTTGDPTDDTKPLHADVKLNLFPSGAAQGKSLVDLDANADVRLASASVPRFELKTLAVNDLKEFQQQFGALVPALHEQKITLDSGAVYANVTGKYEDSTVVLEKPLAVSMPNLSVSKDGRSILDREAITASILGTVALKDGVAANLSDLSVTSKSKLFELAKSGSGPFTFALDKDGAPRGNGQVTLAADLKRLNDLAQAFGGTITTPDQPQLQSGQFNGTITLAKADRPQTSIAFTGEMSNLTVKANNATPIQNEKVTIKLAAVAPDDVQGPNPLTADGQISSSFMTADLSAVQLRLGGGTWDMVQSANVKANVPDLPKLYALANAFAPPAPAPQAPAGEAPIEPLEVTSGQATLDVSIKRDPASKTTAVNLTDAQFSNIALKRGARQLPLDPITLKLAANVNAAGEVINSVNVTELTGDAGIAKISMPKPITITDLQSGKPRAAGSIAATGTIERVTPLLAVLGGGEELPYSGAFTLNQNIANQGDSIQLVGDLTTSQFRVFDTPARANAIFTEDQVVVRNDLALDPNKETATIETLTVDMPASKAVGLSMTGGVSKWSTQRQLQDVKLDLTYDLAKVWPIVKPMLAPETQEQLKDLKVAGQYTKRFELAAPYPSVDAKGNEILFHQAIASLDAHGELSLQSLDAMGVVIEKFDIPINLNNGKLLIEYAGKAKAERLPRPAVCNGGQLDIGGMAVDLTQETPRLNVGKGKRILRNISINPLLGESLGKYVNPMFPNSQRAKGLVDVTIEQAENVALGNTITTDQVGRARIAFSIRDLNIANPLGSLMLGPVVNALKIGSMSGAEADTFEGTIENGVITLENGRTTQDITMQLVDPNQVAAGKSQQASAVTMPMRFQGDVRLADLQQSIQVNLPTGLIGKFLRSDKDRSLLNDIFPRGVPLALRGTTIKPKVDTGSILEQIARGFAESKVRDLIGGDGKDGGGGGLGGLLDDALKKKDKKDKK